MNNSSAQGATLSGRGGSEIVPFRLRKRIRRLAEIEDSVLAARAAGDAQSAAVLEREAIGMRDTIERQLLERRCAQAAIRAVRPKRGLPVRLIDDAWDTLKEVAASRGVDARWFAGALLEEAIYAVSEVGQAGKREIRLCATLDGQGGVRSHRANRYYEVAETAVAIERQLARCH